MSLEVKELIKQALRNDRSAENSILLIQSIGQSEAYFTVLKRLGKVVEMVRFPDCSHLFVRQGHPRLREEYLARTLSWFQKYL